MELPSISSLIIDNVIDDTINNAIELIWFKFKVNLINDEIDDTIDNAINNVIDNPPASGASERSELA